MKSLPTLGKLRSKIVDAMALLSAGLLVGLGLLSFEFSHHAHRHLTDGVVRTHDHAALGPHHHHEEDGPVEPREDHHPSDQENEDLYLGQAAFPYLDQPEPALESALAPLGRNQGSMDSGGPLRLEPYSVPSPRGPPRPLRVTA